MEKEQILIGLVLMLSCLLVVTPVLSSRYIWKEHLNTTQFGETGIVTFVVDGDTLDIEGVGRIRLADLNAPELERKGGTEARDFVRRVCEGRRVYLDIDDHNVTDKYGRIVAVVYIPYNETCYVNLNQLLL